MLVAFGISDSFAQTTAVTTGTVFSDVNRNAVYDAGESGLEGIVVLCTPHGSQNNATRTTTDISGSYRFETQSGCYLTQAEIPGRGSDDPITHAYTAEHPGETKTYDFPSWQTDLCMSGYVLADGQCVQNQQVTSQLLDSLLATIQLIRDELAGLNSKIDRLNAETDGVSIQLEKLRNTTITTPDPEPRDPIDTTQPYITTDRQVYTAGDAVTITGLIPIGEPQVEGRVYADGSSKSFVTYDRVRIELPVDPWYFYCIRDYPFDRERFERLQEHQETDYKFGKFYDSNGNECPIASDGSFIFSGVVASDALTGKSSANWSYNQAGNTDWQSSRTVKIEIRAITVTTVPIPEPNHLIQASLDKTDYVPYEMVIINGTVSGYIYDHDPQDIKIAMNKDGFQYMTDTVFLNVDGSFQYEFSPLYDTEKYGIHVVELSYFGVKHKLEFNVTGPGAKTLEASIDQSHYTRGETITVSGTVTDVAPPINDVTLIILNQRGNIVETGQVTVSTDGTFSILIPVVGNLAEPGQYTIQVTAGKSSLYGEIITFEIRSP